MSKDKELKTVDVDESPRSFAVLLHSIGEGAFHAEVSEAMHLLTKGLEAHAYDFAKAKGTITVKLTVGGRQGGTRHDRSGRSRRRCRSRRASAAGSGSRPGGT